MSTLDKTATPPAPVVEDVKSSFAAEIRTTLEQVVDKWCPKVNPAKKDAPVDSFTTRMARALLELNAFQIDYGRVMAGGKPLRTDYPIKLPNRDGAS